MITILFRNPVRHQSQPSAISAISPTPATCGKSDPKNGSAKLFSKVIPESCFSKLLPKIISQNCVLKLLPKAAPHSKLLFKIALQNYSCSPKQFSKFIPQNYFPKSFPQMHTNAIKSCSEQFLKLPPKVVSKCLPKINF